MKLSVERRLMRLENRPQSQIPQFTIEYSDGHRECWRGMDIMSHISGRDDVERVCFDGGHQPSVDGAALLAVLFDGIEILPKGAEK